MRRNYCSALDLISVNHFNTRPMLFHHLRARSLVSVHVQTKSFYSVSLVVMIPLPPGIMAQCRKRKTVFKVYETQRKTLEARNKTRVVLGDSLKAQNRLPTDAAEAKFLQDR